MRSRLLTRELLEMPQTLARFVEATNRRLDTLESDVAVIKADVQSLKGTTQELREDVESLKGTTQELRDDVQSLKGTTQELRDDVQSLKGTTARIEQNVEALRNDIGPLKASHARNAAEREAYLISQSMGLRYVETLNPEALGRMVNENDTSDLAAGDRRSFIRADLVIRAVDAEDRPCHIAVEISYTANGRDTSRAIRNAGYLTRLTGRPAFPAIAGVRLDNRVRPQTGSGEVFFYDLEDDALAVE